MATYLIFTGQIMGGNGLDMIVISREALGYRGHAQIPTCTFMHKTVCVYAGLMSLFMIVVQLFATDQPLFTGFLFNQHSKTQSKFISAEGFVYVSSCATAKP